MDRRSTTVGCDGPHDSGAGVGAAPDHGLCAREPGRLGGPPGPRLGRGTSRATGKAGAAFRAGLGLARGVDLATPELAAGGAAGLGAVDRPMGVGLDRSATLAGVGVDRCVSISKRSTAETMPRPAPKRLLSAPRSIASLTRGPNARPKNGTTSGCIINGQPTPIYLCKEVRT